MDGSDRWTQPSQSDLAEPLRTAGADAPLWHALEADVVARQVEVDPSLGLNAAEVALRRGRYGRNELHAVGRVPWWGVLGRQFLDVLILILLVAAGISFVIGHAMDAATILVIVLLNGLIGFTQEWRAERALAALQRMLAPRCRVRRAGELSEIAAADLVPGDIVQIAIGDRVPADLRLLSALNLRVDEASLTGESGSVSKEEAVVDPAAPLTDRRSMVWMGTAVANGRAQGVVVATGMGTAFGEIARMTQSVGRESTPLQRKLARLGRRLGVFAFGVSILVGLSGWLLGRDLLDMFLMGVSLAVAVVPEGLPAVVTLTLALGVRTMARKKALLRRLQATETLGAATVICTDKTGTLTKSEMTVQRLWTRAHDFTATGVGYDPAGHLALDGGRIEPGEFPDLIALLKTGVRCNHAHVAKVGEHWNLVGEPTEGALVVAAYKAWLAAEDEDRHAVTEFSFDSTRKRMTIVEECGGVCTAHVKGAPEVILERSTHIWDGAEARPLTDADREEALRVQGEMATQGLRTLALARRTLQAGALDAEGVEQELTLLGVVGMLDPPRQGVAAAVALARGAGIRTLMITGDAPETALAVARQVGLDGTRAVRGEDLAEMDDAALCAALAEPVVFARTTPADKLRIVERLQAAGEIVGMTGDGVNDAPALKKADIGIAMGIRGTDVAQSAADMILTDDNYASIIGAVEEGRREYENIKKFVRYLLSSNTGEVLAIFANLLIGGPLILLPAQILWMNLVTDGLTALALGVEPVGRDLMRRPPRPPGEAILDRRGMWTILGLGSAIAAVTLFLFYRFLNAGDAHSVLVAQTVAFTGIIVAEKVNVLNFRSLDAPLSVVGFFSNTWLLIALGGTLALQACAVYVPFMQTALHTEPLALADWGLILLFSLPVLLIPELFKRFRWQRRQVSERQRGR